MPNKGTFHYDCEGWVTKNDLRCTDGKTIKHGAFASQNNQIVPCVWNHQHNHPSNVLGKCLLETRDGGVWGYISFNDTQSGEDAKKFVKHGDIVSFSIYANNIKRVGNDVIHGEIKEVSLVLAGANPGAKIMFTSFAHSDIAGNELYEAEIECWEPVSHSEGSYTFETSEETPSVDDTITHKEEPKMADTEKKTGEKTVKEVYDAMTEDQKLVVKFMIGAALEDDRKNRKDDSEVKHNAFDSIGDVQTDEVLMHAEQLIAAQPDILASAKNTYKSMKEAVLAHAAEYGIDDISWLFPDPKTATKTPTWIKRETGWVEEFLGAIRHLPFARVKSWQADITEDEARAKGYIKGKYKKEEVFKLLKRSTDPTTIYKKQKLDRDDIIDASALFDVLPWIKEEMRIMFREEVARAILCGDGRMADDEDKIDETRIRPIYSDDELYSIHVPVHVTTGSTNSARAQAFIEKAIRSRKLYKGSGNPWLFTTSDILADLLLLKDDMGRDLFADEAQIMKKLRVSKILDVPVLEQLARTDASGRQFELAGIIVNPGDYGVGQNPGSKGFFDDFDIDYNQQKYLMEDRMSGALMNPFSALVLEFNEDGTVLTSWGPEDGSTVLFGKAVSTLQGRVRINGAGDGLVGLIHYVTGYTGYSGDARLQEGHFLALKFVAPDGATVKVGLTNSEGSGMVELDSDMNCVLRIANNRKQKLVVEATLDGLTTHEEFSLVGLTLEPKES